MPFVDYAVNYNFIAKNLCENRAKPGLMCNGKCYLVKEIAKTNENFPKQDNLKINISGLTDSFIIKDIFAFLGFSDEAPESSEQNYYLTSFYSFSLNSSIFHPPLI